MYLDDPLDLISLSVQYMIKTWVKTGHCPEFHRFLWQLNIFNTRLLFQYKIIKCIYIIWLLDTVCKLRNRANALLEHRMHITTSLLPVCFLNVKYIFSTFNFLIYIIFINESTEVGWIWHYILNRIPLFLFSDKMIILVVS